MDNKYHPLLPETGLVRISTILKIIPVGKSTWHAKVKSGHFPQPVKIGPRITAWRVEDIRKLINGNENGEESWN
jgi:prophage regulatory protein